MVSLAEAIKVADELDLDLVEISPKADPPVCRVIDYQKFLYQQKKKQTYIPREPHSFSHVSRET